MPGHIGDAAPRPRRPRFRDVIRPIGMMLLLLFAFSSLADASEELRLAPDEEHRSVGGYLELTLDPLGELSLDQVMARSEDEFRRLDPFWSGGFSPAVHWFRFTVRREKGAPAEWVLGMGLAFLQSIQVYRLEEGNLVGRTDLGASVPFAQRPLKSHLHALSLTLPEERPVTFYLRVESNTVKAFTADFWTPAAYLAKEARDGAIQGVLLGLLGIIGFVYIIFGLWLRDWGLVAYAGVSLSLMMNVLGPQGYGALLFSPSNPLVVHFFTAFSVFSINAVAPIMWVYFLDMKIHFPRIRRVYLVMSGCAVLAMLTMFHPVYLKLVPLFTLNGVVITFLSLGLVVYRLRRQYDIYLLYYFFAFIAVGVGAAGLVGGLVGVFPLNFWTRHGMQMGSVAHVVILIFAASHRIKQIQIDKIKAQREVDLAQRQAEQQRLMTAMLSHEFRTPLASIDKAAQMVQLTEAHLREGSGERLARIRELSSRLTGLIDLFLTAEALDHDGLQPQPAPAPLQRLFEEMRQRDPERIALDLPPGAAAFIDIDLMRIALGNLVDNALKYSPLDSPVQLSARIEGKSVVISVRDRGKGMSAEEIQRLGARYFRGASAEGTKGTGLGVHMAQSIVQSHGGTFEVRSQPGQGSEITLRLPHPSSGRLTG